MTEPNNDFLFIEGPRYAGCYCIGGKLGVCFSLRKRPPWLHRACMRFFLGWEWFDGGIR